MSDAGKKAKRKAWMMDYIAKQILVLEQTSPDSFEEALGLIEECRLAGGQVFVIGNGGSASNASHFAQDLGKGASDRLERNHSGGRFRVSSLTDNVSWITALGNDYDYDNIFVKQLEAHAKKGDLLIGISVSGLSPNVVSAMQRAIDNGLKTIGLCGRGNQEEPDYILDYSTVKVMFDDDHFGRVEDAMMTFLHMLCYFYMESAEDI